MQAYLILLCFTDVVFYKLKASPCVSKKIRAGFVVIFTLLPLSGTKSSVSPGYQGVLDCIY